MDLQEQESYILFQEISDTFLLISGFISKSDSGLDIKNTFNISKENEIVLHSDKTGEDKELVIKWLKNQKMELIQKARSCITLTQENYDKYKSENPKIKEEIKLRTKTLKGVIRFLEELEFDPLTYEECKKLKSGPDIDSDYAGITVIETKYFLI